MTILLVDDDPEVILLWTNLLKDTGCEVRAAMNLEAAMIEMAKIPPPTFVLLDLKLPPNSPDEVVASVDRFRQYNTNVAIVVVSGMLPEEIRRIVGGANVAAMATKVDLATQDRLFSVLKDAWSKMTCAADSFEFMEKINAFLNPTTSTA